MRKLVYLSPSSLALWESDREAYYLKHLAKVRAPRAQQEVYMAVGSSFDAYVKAALYAAIFGNASDPAFEFDTIFTTQVDEACRDEALKAGKYVFDCYKFTGAYNELLSKLKASECAPQFEFRLDGTVNGVPLMGKPDCRYIHKSGAHIILDWKVNGFYSKHGASPYKFYSLIRDGWGRGSAPPSRRAGLSHPKYISQVYRDVEIGTHFLEETSQDWADQLSIYGWMLGEEPGSEEVIVCVDQIVAKPRSAEFPLLRIANHCCRISKEWQEALIKRLTSCWSIVNSNHIFRELSLEESKNRCEVLEMEAASLNRPPTDIEAWINEIAQPTYRGRAR